MAIGDRIKVALNSDLNSLSTAITNNTNRLNDDELTIEGAYGALWSAYPPLHKEVVTLNTQYPSTSVSCYFAGGATYTLILRFKDLNEDLNLMMATDFTSASIVQTIGTVLTKNITKPIILTFTAKQNATYLRIERTKTPLATDNIKVYINLIQSVERIRDTQMKSGGNGINIKYPSFPPYARRAWNSKLHAFEGWSFASIYDETHDIVGVFYMSQDSHVSYTGYKWGAYFRKKNEFGEFGQPILVAPQGYIIGATILADGTYLAISQNVIYKSTDLGETWTSYSMYVDNV
jgi:uncharacterized protein (DUF2062 family)